MAPVLHVLFEHATGYALFAVKEFEEVSTFLPQVEKAVLDVSKFKSQIVSMTAFSPFKTAVNALENINSVSEGIVHEDLQLFLETNLPKKKSKFTLGVGDGKLGATIQESFGYSCLHVDVVPEILRGIRLHFPKLVEDLTEFNCSKAQLGLGHSYSRSKVKFNVNRVDNMIIQSIAILDQLDKDINVFAMRVREWYSYHYPELAKIVSDNSMYSRLALLIKDRKGLENEELQTKVEELLMDSVKTQSIVDAARASMGMDISPIDLANIEMFASRVISLSEYRKKLMDYLRHKMHDIAPNLTAIVGESIGARLISKAGSLINLAKYPASTVQILGAEKALFRAMKTKGNTPKYGLLFHSTFIGRAQKRDKGRIARYLSNKCSIASRIDCFNDDLVGAGSDSGVNNAVFGEKLREQIEERLKFYESGDVPRKNVDVMTEAEVEAKAAAKAAKKSKKKEKKDKKRKRDTMEGDEENGTGEINTVNGHGKAENGLNDEEPPKKKKKKKSKASREDDDE